MRKELANRISEKGLKVWRWYGVFQTVLVLLFSIGAIVITYITEGPWWIYGIASVIPLLVGYIFIYLFPKIRWSRWRYEVRDSEIELQHGLFIVKRTLIPMIRVQHVDTAQGPILRKYHLSAITISTAATNHTIPALVAEEADALRSRISILARVAEEDV